MKTIFAALLILGLSTGLHAQNQPKKTKPILTIGKQTTYVTGPIDKDGYIDYATALNKIMSEGVTPENNANVLLWQAFGPCPLGETVPADYFKLMGIRPPPSKGEYVVDLHRRLIKLGTLDPTKDDEKFGRLHQRITSRPWNAKQFPHVAKWLKSQGKPMAFAIQATKRTHYFSPTVTPESKNEPSSLLSTHFPQYVACRNLADALAARAMLHIDAGDIDQAKRDLLTIHRLGRLVGRGSTLVERDMGLMMESIAYRAQLAMVQYAEMNAKEIKAYQAELHSLPSIPLPLGQINLGERFIMLDLLMLSDRFTHDGWCAKTIAKLQTSKVDWDPALRTVNAWFDKLGLIVRLKDRRVRSAELSDHAFEPKKAAVKSAQMNALQMSRMSMKARSTAIANLVLAEFAPAVSNMLDRRDRIDQVQSNLHVAFALAAYKSDHRQYPDKLDVLAPRYLKQIPHDVFGQKPLVYRPSAKGYLLYSVGVDGIDDKGRGPDDNPLGDDLSVRMPLPELEK